MSATLSPSGRAARDGSEAAGPAIFVSARLMVDVGDAGATPQALRLRMTATGAEGNVIMASAPAATYLSRESVDAMNAHTVLSGAPDRLFGGEAAEAAHGASMGRDLATQLNDALVP